MSLPWVIVTVLATIAVNGSVATAIILLSGRKA